MQEFSYQVGPANETYCYHYVTDNNESEAWLALDVNISNVCLAGFHLKFNEQGIIMAVTSIMLHTLFTLYDAVY